MREIRHEPWQLRCPRQPRLRSTSTVLATRELPGWQGGGPLKRSEQRRAPRGARPDKGGGTRHLQQPSGCFAGGTRQTVGRQQQQLSVLVPGRSSSGSFYAAFAFAFPRRGNAGSLVSVNPYALGNFVNMGSPPPRSKAVCIVIDPLTLSIMLLTDKASCASATSSMFVMLVQAYCKPR